MAMSTNHSRWREQHNVVIRNTVPTIQLVDTDGDVTWNIRSGPNGLEFYETDEAVQFSISPTAGPVFGTGTALTVSNGDGSTNLTPKLQVVGTTKASSSILVASFNTTDDLTVGPTIGFLKSGNATVGSNTTVASGEVLGDIIWYGADGTDFESPAAAIRVVVDAAVGTGDLPGRFVFLTTADGGETLTEALRITSSQDVRINDGGGLIVGSTSAQVTVSDGDGATNLVPEVQVLGTTAADASVLLASFSATATSAAAPKLNFLKSANATIGSNTIVASGEVLGEVNFFGADGTDFESCAVSIRGLADAAPGVGDMPGRLSVFTSTDAAETPTERLRVTGTATLSTAAIGIAGATTGQVTFAGATSGVVTLKPNATAGTWTLELPAAVGSAGQQLTDAGGNGVTSWAAASLGAWKHDLGVLDPAEALAAVVAAPTHKFRYNAEVMPAGQWAPQDLMTGIFAEEAPWAMHGERDGLKSGIAFSSINAFGYIRAAVEALNNKIAALEAQVLH